MTTDSQRLLANYVRNGSEDAFREVVGRYLDLVFSTALRLVEADRHRAEDVAQMVFADLARMAPGLSSELMLGGWLHRHTCFVARKLMRGERRRQARERKAAEMNALDQQHNAVLAEISPFLDEAINDLGSDDREAILLRFFERRNLRDVGEALGVNENVAQKRVARALQELGTMLRRHGLTMSAAALGSGLAAGAVKAAPLGLVLTVAKAALAASGAAAGTSALSKQLGALLNLKSGIIALLLAGVTGMLLLSRPKAPAPAGSGLAVVASSAKYSEATAASASGLRPVLKGSGKTARAMVRAPRDGEVLARNESLSSPHSTLASPAALETTSAVPALPQPRRFVSKSGSSVLVQGTSSAGDWQAKSQVIVGHLEMDSSLFPLPTRRVTPGPVAMRAEAAIPITSLYVADAAGGPDNKAIDSLMRETLAIGGRSYLLYRLRSASLSGVTNLDDGPHYLLNSRGDLVVAGTTNEIAIPVAIIPLDERTFKVATAFSFSLSNFGIKPPSLQPWIDAVGDRVNVTIEWLSETGAHSTAPSLATLVPLVLDLPAPAFTNIPQHTFGTEVEPFPKTPRAPLMVPPGLTNAALGATLACSDRNINGDTLRKLVDGDKAGREQSIVYLRKGLQWVQLDLGAPQEIFAIVVWHAHDVLAVYHDVIVAVADDSEFHKNLRVLFNNDRTNAAGLGVGTDREYFETHEGKLLDCDGARARFLRFYSKGSTQSALNAYTEIEVYARPAR